MSRTQTLVLALVLVVAYLSSYLTLVGKDDYYYSERFPYQSVERYSCCDSLARDIFAPLNRVDRLVRPGYWTRPA